MQRRLLTALVRTGLAALPGCLVTEVKVSNPIPGMTTIAVAPFFNLSAEPTVDGQRFALAYFSELQKVPGYQVIPVGVAEQAIFDNKLQMNDPEDVLRLADILGADAVVVGAVTEFNPYYPPRVGLQVSWYSPRQWEFYPGVPIDLDARDRWKHERDVLEEVGEPYRKERKLSRKLERDGVARRFAGVAKHVLVLFLVYFDHDPINQIIHLTLPCFPVRPKVNGLIYRFSVCVVGVHLKAKRLQIRKLLVLGLWNVPL